MFHDDYHNCEPLLCNRELKCPIHQIMDWADEINSRIWENDESQRITMCDMNNLDKIIITVETGDYADE